MTPPSWHSQVFELALNEIERIDQPFESLPVLLFVKHGQVHMRVLFSDAEDADEPSKTEAEISQRIAALQGTIAEAYATARLALWNDDSGNQSWAISVSGAEADDDNETTWLQRVEFNDEGQIFPKDTWVHEEIKRENAINPW